MLLFEHGNSPCPIQNDIGFPWQGNRMKNETYSVFEPGMGKNRALPSPTLEHPYAYNYKSFFPSTSIPNLDLRLFFKGSDLHAYINSSYRLACLYKGSDFFLFPLSLILHLKLLHFEIKKFFMSVYVTIFYKKISNILISYEFFFSILILYDF